MDFRNDTFLAFRPEVVPVHVHVIRSLCRDTGGFEPHIESIVNSSEDMISMVAAGRGVWLAPEIAVHSRLESINYQRLNAIERRLEVSAIWKKRAELPATAQQFMKVLKKAANSTLAERCEPRRQPESLPHPTRKKKFAPKMTPESNRRSANFEKASWPIALSGIRGTYPEAKAGI
jgi:LysR substrate binding domain